MWRTGVRTAAALSLVLGLAVSAAAQAAAPTGRLLVTVVDQTGGVLPDAAVAIAAQDDASHPPVAPGAASAAGVATFDALPVGRYTLEVTFPGLEPATAKDVRVRAGENRHVVTLRLRGLDERITVGRDAQSVSLDLNGPTFSTVLTREMIEALPDDPDEMEAALEIMAPGARLQVDGFSGGKLPPKSQIKSIRLPRMDAMAAQNHGGRNGFLFIDIKTQPGAGPPRGTIDGTFHDSVLSARNPFTPVKGDEQTRQYGASFASTLVPNKTSISINAGGTSQFTSPTLLAVRPDGSTLADALRRPTDVVNAAVRVDHALTPDHALRVSLDRNWRQVRNQGIGGFNLPSRAFQTSSATNTIRLAEGGALKRRMYTESRLQLSWSSQQSQAAAEMPTVRVLDAFTGGGAQVRGGRHEFEVDAASDLDYVRGPHSWRTGVLVEGGRYRSDDTTNYLGTYTFASLADYNAGRPSSYTQRLGDPGITYSLWKAGLYVQDDWRVARRVLISAGVRAGTQTLAGDPVNVSPRITVAWSPRSDSKLTVRAAYGYLYDWIDGGLYKQTQLVDGSRLQELNVNNPSYPAPPLAGAASATNKYLWSETLTQPINHRTNLGVDREFASHMRVNGSYTLGRGRRLMRGRNLNPPLNGVRGDAGFANVVALVSDAEERNHTASVGWNMTRSDWKRAFFAVNYTWSNVASNTSGAFALPANGDNLDTEWGAVRARHAANASMNLMPVKQFNVNVNARFQSGAPYNLTTGRDDNLDGLFSDRPAGVSRNSARMSAQSEVNGKLSYAWFFGPAAPGGPGGRGTAENGGSTPRFRMDFWMSFQNLLNRANYVGYSGVMTSPFFAQPTNVLNPRRVQMGVRFGF